MLCNIRNNDVYFYWIEINYVHRKMNNYVNETSLY